MDAKLPAGMPEGSWHQPLIDAGITRIHRGKVRDTYRLKGERLLLQVATDRISIFDFVLAANVARKGETLTAMTIHWLKHALKLQRTDDALADFGCNIDNHLPSEVRGQTELWRRGLVVAELGMEPVECIVRGYLTGSGFKSYTETQTVCGHKLPANLFDGAKLPQPLFTPTTKAEEGHDEDMLATSVNEVLAGLSLDIYEQAAAYAADHGIIIADTKFEFGFADNVYGHILGDEVLTPDSSRFWDADEWVRASRNHTAPPSYDKEVVRKWGKTISTPWGLGLDNKKLDPKNIEHVKFVQAIPVPIDVLGMAAARYQVIFERLTAVNLSEFQRRYMGIPS